MTKESRYHLVHLSILKSRISTDTVLLLSRFGPWTRTSRYTIKSSIPIATDWLGGQMEEQKTGSRLLENCTKISISFGKIFQIIANFLLSTFTTDP